MMGLKIVDATEIVGAERLQKIAEFEKLAKEIKAKEDALKDEILKTMESFGILNIETPELKISYVAPTNRETFDSKTFRKDFEDLYDEYVVVTPVKSSIRIKVK